MDWFSKDKMAYDEVKMVFNDEIVKSADIIASEKTSDNRTRLLKILLDLGEVFSGKFYSVKIFDKKYEVAELKIKQMINSLNYKTQNEPLELDKEKKRKI